jgi:hypothetical protein
MHGERWYFTGRLAKRGVNPPLTQRAAFFSAADFARLV